MPKLIALAVVSVAAALAALPSSPAAAYTQEQQAACQDDAFRVCGEFIPDEQRTRACMITKRTQLSARCQAQFKDEEKPVKASAGGKKKPRKTAN
jgi:hypothetical protein